MIAAPVQCDVDGIPKGSHSLSVSPTGKTHKLAKIIVLPWSGRSQPAPACQIRPLPVLARTT